MDYFIHIQFLTSIFHYFNRSWCDFLFLLLNSIGLNVPCCCRISEPSYCVFTWAAIYLSFILFYVAFNFHNFIFTFFRKIKYFTLSNVFLYLFLDFFFFFIIKFTIIYITDVKERKRSITKNITWTSQERISLVAKWRSHLR